jgi:hypothetical protein
MSAAPRSQRKKRASTAIEVLGASNWYPSANGEGSFLVSARGSRGIEIQLLGYVHRGLDGSLRFDVPGLSAGEFEKLAGSLRVAVTAMLRDLGCAEDVRPVVAEQLKLFDDLAEGLTS